MYNLMKVHIMIKDYLNANRTSVGKSTLYIILVGISNKINNTSK